MNLIYIIYTISEFRKISVDSWLNHLIYIIIVIFKISFPLFLLTFLDLSLSAYQATFPFSGIYIFFHLVWHIFRI